jgi:glycosyltransferase involved in cell wall biosynthesis
MQNLRIFAYNLGDLTSGQARFVRTLSAGLRKIGLETSIGSAWATERALHDLESAGVSVQTQKIGSPTGSRQQREIMLPRRMLKELSAQVRREDRPDWILVLSDELISIARYLDARARTAYVTNGDFTLLFFNESYYYDGRVGKTIASVLASSRILGHARDARKYDMLLANSEFTRDFMSYLYGIPFTGVCYPPVDFDRFRPSSPKATPPFALAVSRNLHEQGVRTLERLAGKVRLRVVGGLQIQGAESMGIVDDSTLATLYSQATVVVSTVVSEFFGYSIAEALACGSPVACYSVCGPGELVRDGINGWRAESSEDLIATVERVVNGQVPAISPDKIRESASVFRDIEVATRLRNLAEKCERSPAIV